MKNALAIILLGVVLMNAHNLFNDVNEAQGVVVVDDIWHVVRSWSWSKDDVTSTSTSYASAATVCKKLIETSALEVCTKQLEEKLNRILNLQYMAKDRYIPMVQFWWMSSIMIRTKGGNFIIQYLPFIEERTMVLDRFLDHYELRQRFNFHDMKDFHDGVTIAMDDVSNRRILLLSLLIPSVLCIAISSFIKCVNNQFSKNIWRMSENHPRRLPVVKGSLSAVLRANNKTFIFKLGRIRLLLAYVVILFHSMEMTGNEKWHDPLFQTFSIDIGTFAASITHAISGILSYDAVHRHGSAKFLLRRALRIWPSFIFLAIISVFILGPICTGNIWYMFSRGGRRVFWWCISGEFLFSFSSAIEIPLTFENGETLVSNFRTTVAVALWSMPQLTLSWLILSIMHASTCVHFIPLAMVTLSTLIGAGTGKDVYIAYFFFGASCGAVASKIPVLTNWYFSFLSTSMIFACAWCCSCLNLHSVHSQCWKVLAVFFCYHLLAWCGKNDSKERKQQNHGTKQNDAKINDASASLVLGTYVFGSGIQSVLATIVGRKAVLEGISATIFNFCLSLPIISFFAWIYSRLEKLVKQKIYMYSHGHGNE